MMCYRDMTFCDAHECKKFSTCERALNLEVQRAADKWWGKEGAPICTYIAPPESCYEKDNG